ncbi:MAG: hypothetical protein IT406_00620 [Candidatus Yanofskybacteria bacterium]|nr:hypothetical protein [Candidatus Yanofskybacteria bacterium]
MTEANVEALQSQIAALERQLAERRSTVGGDTAQPYERHEVHAAIGERIKQAIPGYQTAPSTNAPVGDAPSWQDPALAAQVQELVNVAFTKGLQEALAQALKTENPALVDAFHDVLADQLHQELLNRNTITPAP